MESKARFLIKIFFGNDNNIRRYSFDKSPTWAGFYETFKQLFRAEYNPTYKYKFEYVDPEGDRVVIDTDVEWQEMIYLYKDASIIKLHVTEQAQERPKPQEKQVEENYKYDQQEKAREEAEKKARDVKEKDRVTREMEEKLQELARKYMQDEEKAREEAEKKAREDAEKKST